MGTKEECGSVGAVVHVAKIRKVRKKKDVKRAGVSPDRVGEGGERVLAMSNSLRQQGVAFGLNTMRPKNGRKRRKGNWLSGREWGEGQTNVS